MNIQFLGADRQVTGSCHLLETNGLRLLIDCGMYQERPYLERNWNPFPVPPETIDFVLLTHAHIDHCGLLPKIAREGLSGRILTTPASAELLSIVLLDAAHIQEEDAAFKKKRHLKEGRKGLYPEIPLYTEADVFKVLPLVETAAYDSVVPIGPACTARFHDAGHILGSAMIEVVTRENEREGRIIFSGDVGQWNKPLVQDPSVFREADVIVMESTYGDRDHDDPMDPADLLARFINETVASGGNIVIPTFALERAQELLFHLGNLTRRKQIPEIPVFLDSPMAVEVTDVFNRHPEYLDEEIREILRMGEKPFQFPGLKLVRSAEESKVINRVKGSCIIMAGSGMCTGGRIKHHLFQNISRPESTILFVGYQARGTLGRQIRDKQREVRIFGRQLPVMARVAQINGFSAHASRSDLLRWLSHYQSKPTYLFLTHGEKDVCENLAADLNKDGWNALVPEYGEDWELALT